MSCDDFNEVYEVYKAVIVSDIEKYTSRKERLKLPIIPEDILQSLLSSACVLLEMEPIVLSLHSPLVIVGDIHGHFFDLVRILNKNGLPPDTTYLFLGDIVDRGEFNLEVFTLIILLKYFFPENIFILRGNHEFEQIVDHSLLHGEVHSLYADDVIIDEINSIFANISLAATIDDDYAICLHGGICSGLYFLDQIRELKKPIVELEANPLVCGIVWSDPSSSIEEFGPSIRGVGEEFGIKVLSQFLSRNKNAFMLIRGHQVVDGFESLLNHRVATVFSASSYCGNNSNKAGVIKFVSECRYEVETYPPLPYLKRTEIGFLPWNFFQQLKKERMQKKRRPFSPTSPTTISTTTIAATTIATTTIATTTIATNKMKPGIWQPPTSLPKLPLSGIRRNSVNSRSMSSNRGMGVSPVGASSTKMSSQTRKATSARSDRNFSRNYRDFRK